MDGMLSVRALQDTNLWPHLHHIEHVMVSQCKFSDYETDTVW